MAEISYTNLESMTESSFTYKLVRSWHHQKSSLAYSGWYFLPEYTVSYMISGKIRMELRDEHQKIRTIHWQSGDIVFIPPSLFRHTEIMDNHDIHFIGIALNFTVFQHFDPFLMYDFPVLYRGELAEQISHHMKKIIALEKENSLILSKVAIRKASIFSIFSQLVSQATPKANYSKKFFHIQRLLPAIQYLNANENRIFDYAYAAKLCNLSPSRFYAVFKEVMNCSPGEYSLMLRLTRASQMLLESDQSLAEVAWRCGWNDVFHFSRIFKRYFNLAPKFYREKARSMLDMGFYSKDSGNPKY